MQHVFRQIIGRRRIVWVNAIGHRVPGIRDLGRAFKKVANMLHPATAGSAFRIGSERPDVIIQPRVLPWHNVRRVHEFNTASLLNAIRAALARCAPGQAPVLVTGTPPSAGIVGKLGEVASVYFCMDDFLHLPGVSAWMIEPLERQLLASVDALVATAHTLTESKRPASGRVHYLPQGVNYDHFARPLAVPQDLSSIPHPRILFAGGISGCVSFPLLDRLAAALPSASVVLIGPVTTTIRGLSAPNVHLMGVRPYADLPAYVQHCDVGIIPYVLNEWTMAVDPLKLLEYCAAGLPVVTTAIPEVLKYSDSVAVARTDAEFVSAVGAILNADRRIIRERGQRLARQNTWAQRAEDLLAIIDDIAAPRLARDGQVAQA